MLLHVWLRQLWLSLFSFLDVHALKSRSPTARGAVLYDFRLDHLAMLVPRGTAATAAIVGICRGPPRPRGYPDVVTTTPTRNQNFATETTDVGDVVDRQVFHFGTCRHSRRTPGEVVGQRQSAVGVAVIAVVVEVVVVVVVVPCKKVGQSPEVLNSCRGKLSVQSVCGHGTTII